MARATLPLAWAKTQMVNYLHTGAVAVHGAAAGPMREVTRHLAGAGLTDVESMAGSLTLRTPIPAPSPIVEADASRDAILCGGACAACRGPGLSAAGAIPLRASTAIWVATPDNFFHLVIEGHHPPDGAGGAVVPSFGAKLTGRQIAAIAHLVRHENGLPDWPDDEARASTLQQPGKEAR